MTPALISTLCTNTSSFLMNSSFMHYYYAGVSRSRARKTRDPVVEDSAAPVRRATRSTRRYVRVLTHLSARWCPLHFRPRRLKDRRLLLCSHGMPFYSSSHVRFVPHQSLGKRKHIPTNCADKEADGAAKRQLKPFRADLASRSRSTGPQQSGAWTSGSESWLALSFLRDACRSSFSSLIPGQANNDLP
jgi:hypothetical protein